MNTTQVLCSTHVGGGSVRTKCPTFGNFPLTLGFLSSNSVWPNRRFVRTLDFQAFFLKSSIIVVHCNFLGTPFGMQMHIRSMHDVEGPEILLLLLFLFCYLQCRKITRESLFRFFCSGMTLADKDFPFFCWALLVMQNFFLFLCYYLERLIWNRLPD